MAAGRLRRALRKLPGLTDGPTPQRSGVNPTPKEKERRLAEARGDRQTAQILPRAARYNAGAYHGQQSAEKALKSILQALVSALEPPVFWISPPTRFNPCMDPRAPRVLLTTPPRGKAARAMG